MRELTWTLRTYFRRIGPMGMLGLAVLAIGICAIPLYFWPMASANQALAKETGQLQSRATPGDVRLVPNSLQDQLRSFRAMLPSVQDIPQILSTIHATASARGINLSEGELKLVSDEDSEVERYQMIFPVHAEYAPTRDFVRDAMRQVPALALEEMRFQRTDPDSPELDVKVAFTLFLKADNAGSSK